MVSTNNPKVTEGTTPDERDTNNPPGDESVSENAQPVVPVGPQLSVRVFKTFPGAEKASPEAVCKVGSAATFENESLGYLRKYLNNQKILNSIDSALPFCTADGARVEETTTISEYARLVHKKSDTGTVKRKDGGSASTEAQEPVDGSDESDKLTTCDVYLIARKKTEVQLSDPVKNLLDSALDMNFSQSGDLPKAVLKQLKSSYDHKLWAAEVDKGPRTYPAEMSEEDWAIVMQNNDLLHGLRVIPARAPDNKLTLNGIDRSFLPAFTLKPRPVEFYKKAPGVEVDTTVGFAIPRFRIQDDSYVRMTEAKTDVESSFARSSFSQHDFQVAAGGNVFGYDVGAKFGFSAKEQDGYAQARQENVEMMHISYNFPRVVIRLDENSLELDPVCRSRLDKVTDFNSMSEFFADYGQFFATQVQLGGRLHAAEDIKSTSSSVKEEKANAFKAAVSASFSGPSARGSTSYSHESKSTSDGTEQKISYNKSMSWEAQGGDTLLCNSPPDWCPTVHSFYNWRTIKQENVVFLPDLIGKLPGFKHIPDTFKKIAKNQKPDTATSKVPYFVEFSLELEGSEGKEFSLDEKCPGTDGDNIVAKDEYAMALTPTFLLPAVYKHWLKVKLEMGGKAIHVLPLGNINHIGGLIPYSSLPTSFGGDPSKVRRVTSRNATQAAKVFKIRTENVKGNKLAIRGQKYQIDNPGESMSLSATSNLMDYVPQSYLFAATSPQTPVKFAFWDTELADDEQEGSIPDGHVVSLVAWIPNSDKRGFVCLRDSGGDFEILPGSPDLNKVARFKIKYGKAYEAPPSAEVRRREAAVHDLEDQLFGERNPATEAPPSAEEVRRREAAVHDLEDAFS